MQKESSKNSAGQRLKRAIESTGNDSKIRVDLITCRECKIEFIGTVVNVNGADHANDICIKCETLQRNLESTCDCGRTMTRKAIRLRGTWEMVYICDHCKDKNELYRRSVEEQYLRYWHSITPPEYRNTDVDKLPLAELSKKVLRFEIDNRKEKPGLWLYGASGLGKTRTMYLLLYKLICKGKSIRLYKGDEFNNEVGQVFSDISGWKEWQRGLLNADVLVFDDFGKGVLTERVQQAIFSIIEMRMSYNKPIIVTTNEVYSTLRERIRDDNLLGPLYRRLIEFTEQVKFTKGK